MVNVVAFNDFTSSSRGGGGSEISCWLCQKPTALRGLFCAHCGAVQPVRAIDHFSRLGLERRIDIDGDLLEKQYESFKKALDPAVFAQRGLGERGHATKQLEALEAAYSILRDPLERGRYWLSLHQQDVDEAEAANPLLAALRAELEAEVNVAMCDRIAQKAGQALEQGIMSLMQALRGQNWQHANAMLVELDGLEALLGDVRDQRANLCAPAILPKDGGNVEDGADAV